MDYNLVICGGTFDRLHEGHKAFLRFAFEKGKKVLIGLTTDKYVSIHKKNTTIFAFEKRKKELEEFLRREGFLERARIVSIDSRFDNTQVLEENGTALLVTNETYASGLEINKEREKNKLSPLPLLIFPLIQSNKKEKISSSKIRDGIMTREGILLPDKSFLSKSLFIPQEIRYKLHSPFGILFTQDIPKQFLRNQEKIVTVGDVITKRIHSLEIVPKIAVIDFSVERRKTHESFHELGFKGDEKTIHVINPSGQLSSSLWKKVLQATKRLGKKNAITLIVEGEEDLLVIPLILVLPLGFFIFYGQPALTESNPQKGVVILEVTEELKKQTYRLLKQFTHK